MANGMTRYVRPAGADNFRSRRGDVRAVMRSLDRVVRLALLLLALLVAPALANSPAEIVKRPVGAVVVPDQFLRSWDPVTLFFDKDTGPAEGGAEDHPEKLLTGPKHPGAYTWLDARTLQFRPAEPWPALSRVTWAVGGRTVTLATLMAAPDASSPADNTEGLKPVDAITLRFPHPLDVAALARMVTIDLRPLPGVEGDRQRTLTSRDFDIKVVERNSRTDPATYVLNLKTPISWGVRAIVRLRLAEMAGLEGLVHDIRFATTEEFRIRNFGCRTTVMPATVAGTSYGREQALTCPADERMVRVVFSARPQAMGPVEARNLVRLTPAVEDLQVQVVDDTLQLRGRFEADRLYQVRLEPAALTDQEGRPLTMRGASQLFLSFPAKQKFLRFEAHSGVVERFGAQMIPLRGRGYDKVDLRIHAIEPLDRNFWPFLAVETDEAQAPPAPGEEPRPHTYAFPVDKDDIAQHLRTLGTPGVSTMVPLPLRTGDTSARFGLDLQPHLERLAGKGAPGTYLVGLRQLGVNSVRSWMRVQVTDLSLTAVEETDQVRFVVTSLATAEPVADAMVSIEGSEGSTWQTVGKGTTDADGQFAWQPEGLGDRIRRVVVTKGNDTLVLDAAEPPNRYAANGGWQADEEWSWLSWTLYDPGARQPEDQWLCHIFTERPIYRPDDPMHIKGYVRDYSNGALSVAQGQGVVLVKAPDGTEWRYPVDLTSDAGSFHFEFKEKTSVTGKFQVRYLHGKDETDLCHRSVKREAYRLPRFEVQMHGPGTAPLDAPFAVQMTARYYAGGNVVERPIHWRVTQMPYAWVPKPREGFRFSTDSRFSRPVPFRSTPAVEREDKTDPQGSGAITIDPTIEPTAHPRHYVVEATVTGDDDQTVTSVHDVLALPPFVLGVKVPRYLEQVDNVEPELIVAGHDGEGLAGQAVTVRLIKRQWNSILQAGDFSSGAAKYVTEVVEEVVSEQVIRSTAGPMKLSLPLTGTGVYLVQLEAEDKLGRMQSVTVDFFAAGTKPTTWSRPPAQVFKATPEKTRYNPGETARIILESPFQTGAALAIVEEPDGHNSYTWVPVRNGYGVFSLAVRKEYLPKLPVHFALMRGRLPGGGEAKDSVDLRKPATLASSTAIEVTPAKHRVTVDLDYPKRAQPGDEVSVTVKLSDDEGKPLAGEVTLWLIDQAVLALAKEQPLDPIPDFIVERPARAVFYDSRNQVFGVLPLQEDPGGDGEEAEGALLDQVGVRKNFTPVPYYNPRLMVDASGTAKVTFTLPDSLTNFRLRAKVVSGDDRFGFGTGEMKVRLPVIVQPALPRFVRPGDAFTLAAIGRIVEGEFGPGRASIKLDGLKLDGTAERGFEWTVKPTRVEYPVTVPEPPLKPDGEPSRSAVTVTVGVERSQDKARDAFQVELPIQPDRPPQTIAQVFEMQPGTPVTVPPLPEPARDGTATRTALVSAQPAATLMAAALDYLHRYPYGCTEQRISTARAAVAARRFDQSLMPKTMASRVDRDVAATLAWISNATTGDGLVAFWPGSRGYVALTAWSVLLMVEAHDAGLPVDVELRDRLIQALKRALRSDAGVFVDSYGERTWALTALAAAGQLDLAYAAELTRRAEYLSQESTAQALRVLASSRTPEAGSLDRLKERLWSGIVIRSHQGRDVFGGLQAKALSSSGVILPTETRAVAQTLRAQLAAAPGDPRNQMLIDALAGLGRGDGWGSTNANAEALLALADALAKAEPLGGGTAKVAQDDKVLSLEVTSVRGTVPLSIRPDTPAAVTVLGEWGKPVLWVRTSFVPAAPGSAAAAVTQGFVVSRAALRIQAGGAPPLRVPLDKPGLTLDHAVGAVIEDEVELVNPADRHHVAITIPLAAGMEPLNPALATAPPEAMPSAQPELAPSYVSFLDDRVEYFYETLPKGTYHFRFRSRATIPGRFTQPAARAQMMYDDAVVGASPGALVSVVRGAE